MNCLQFSIVPRRFLQLGRIAAVVCVTVLGSPLASGDDGNATKPKTAPDQQAAPADASATVVLAADATESEKPADAVAPNPVWPQWRGTTQQGIAPDGDYPTKWTDESASKVEIPGTGGSTPVVVGDVAYLTSGIDGKNHLLAVDLVDSQIRWKTPMGDDRGNKHRKGSGSNPSPVTDGNLIAAYFRSGDLVCADTNGDVVWKHNLQEDFGEDTLWWDLGSSPLLVDSMVVVAVMQTGPSYLIAYDLATGERRWKSERTTGAPEEAAQSYSTPLAVEIDGESAIAVMGADTLTLTRAKDGKEIGRLGGFNPDQEKYFRSISSPVAEDDLIICPYARGATLTAVDMPKLASGASQEAIVWFRDDLGSDVPTPALQAGMAYVVTDGKRNKGTVHALDAATGETRWSIALPKSRAGYSSSPLIAGNHLYVTNEQGGTTVLGPLDSDNPKVIASNDLGDSDPFTVASPVPVKNESGRDGIGVRTKRHLYVILND